MWYHHPRIEGGQPVRQADNAWRTHNANDEGGDGGHRMMRRDWEVSGRLPLRFGGTVTRRRSLAEELGLPMASAPRWHAAQQYMASN